MAVTPGTCTLDTAAGDIWCGVLTVGAVSSNQDGFFGSTGGLTDTTFSVGSSNYMIEQLTVESPTATNAGDLLLGLGRDRVLSAANRARLVLHVDDSGDMFAFNATAASGFSHLWTGTDLDWSSATTVTLRLRLTPEVPGKPTNLMAEADGSTRIALSWEAPADDGGSAITGYRIEVSPDGSSDWDDLVADTGNDDTSYTHEGLSAGDTRHYRVSAINAEGTSDASDSDSATTVAAGTCALNPGDIWCGVVTVERFSIPPLPLYGFGAGKGGLSDPDFTYGSNSYTIDVAANELNNELLYFSLTSSLTAGDRAALELHVDGSSASFALSAATHNSSEHNYTWTGTGLNWFVTPTVTLRLRAATETDATLRALTVTRSGGVNVPLQPTFAPGTEEYAAPVANTVDEVTVAAEANAAGATVAYLDAGGTAIPDADTGTPGREVALEVGANTVQVKVTAEDTTTTRTYTVTVTRRAPDAPGVEGEWRLMDMEPATEGGVTARAEVFHAGRWGTVCSDGIRDKKFDVFNYDANNELVMVTDTEGNEVPSDTEYANEAAALICQDMGYTNGEYHGKYKYTPGGVPDHQEADYWPPGSPYSDAATPIWIDDLRCVPDGTALTGTAALPGAMSHCSYAGWGLHNCTHKEDAVVRCWNEEGSTEAQPSHAVGPLTAAFADLPSRHEGTAFTFRIEFSEDVAVSTAEMRDQALTVTGGTVTGAAQVGGRADLWSITVTPSGTEEMTISLLPGRGCAQSGAVCTSDGRQLSTGLAQIVAGPPVVPLTASFEAMPEAHDGESAFTFRIAFSEPLSWMNGRRLREDVVAVAGGRATTAGRVDRRRDLWQVTVEPDSGADVTVTLAAGAACGTPAAVCTSDGRALSATISATVAGPAVETGPAALTASFVDMPDEHDGESAFTFRIAFSERVGWMNGRRLREHVVAVTGGRATSASRVNRRRDLWQVTVEPDSLADVTVTLEAGAACRTPAAVCTSDGRALSNSISATVRGPVTVSVADARAEEGADETIDFAVTLEPGGIRHGHGGLCDRRRDGDGGRGLHARRRHAQLRAGRDGEDGRGAGARRRARRGRGDADAAAHGGDGRADRRRGRDGHDRERRPHAAGVAGAVRAHRRLARGRRTRRAPRRRRGAIARHRRRYPHHRGAWSGARGRHRRSVRSTGVGDEDPSRGSGANAHPR